MKEQEKMAVVDRITVFSVHKYPEVAAAVLENKEDKRYLEQHKEWIGCRESLILETGIDEEIKKILEYPTCPICGIRDVDGLIKSYRDNHGCVGSVRCCTGCHHLNNDYFREVRDLKTLAEKDAWTIKNYYTDIA